jgi:pyridoxamine 5'-phosphate oxidase
MYDDCKVRHKEISTGSIQRPHWWGGYRLIPRYFEYWKGKESGLDERLSFELTEKMAWLATVL